MKSHPFMPLWKSLAAGLFLAVFPGAAFAAPSISVSPSGTYDFGNVKINTTVEHTFTITNGGDAVTASTTAVVTGAGFALTQAVTPTAIAASNGTATFKVSFNPTAVQNYSGATSKVVITSTGATNSPITVLLTGDGVAPEIEVKSVATGLVLGNGNAVSISTTFPAVTLNGNTNTATSTRSFSIKNRGLVGLGLVGTPKVAVSGTNAADFTVDLTALPSTVATNVTVSFTVTFTPSARGDRLATLTISNDDPNEGTFVINVKGVGQAPEIVVEQPENSELPVGS